MSTILRNASRDQIDQFHRRTAMKKNTGGDAFPWTNDDTTCTGMTLRDYFAAKAMQAFIYPEGWQGPVGEVASFAAENSYMMADAMMEAREL